MPDMPLCPEDLDFVVCKLPVCSEDTEIFKTSLGNQKAIERISMVQRQRRYVKRVRMEDG